MANNNIYLELEGNVYKRYEKVPVNIVSGLRANPLDTKLQVGWSLTTSEDDFSFKENRRTAFVYETEVIEIYSELEDKIFRRLNKNLFDKGLLKVHAGLTPEYDFANFITDEQVGEIINIRTMDEFKNKLDTYNSVSTLNRIKDAAVAANKSIKKVQLIDTRIEVVQDNVAF